MESSKLSPDLFLDDTPVFLANCFKRLVRDPLIHFLLIGAGIYGAYAVLDSGPVEGDASTITVTREEIQSLTEQWTRLWNRPPTEAELAQMLRNHVRTRILYKEAVAMGLDRQDQVIERRLAQKVELLSKSLVTPEPPTDEVLAAWFADNVDRFREPDTYTLYQVFFDPDLRGGSASTDAEATLADLQALPQLPEDFSAYGDHSIMQNYYPGRSEVELGKVFGRGFGATIVDLQPGQWQGPILSGFGTHLVYVKDIQRPAAPALADIRDAVAEAWMLEQVETLGAQFIDDLIARYDIVVEATEVAMTVPPQEAGE